MTRLMRLMGLMGLMGLLGLGLPGCGLPKGINTIPEQLGKALEGLTSMVKDQGVLENFTTDAEGNFVNPGVETYAGVIIVSGVRLQGVSGQIAAKGSGTGTMLPPELRASLIRQLDGPISDEQRAAILEILGWNREQVPAPEGD